ncbi:D-amino acid dehydrogenase [Parasalinivibrio latis]|uniref:D-amino acid dehydrogenase n=1 Tax=Parasalinivibrio latis TaxID=2952610 RepID=UPI0030E43E84
MKVVVLGAGIIGVTTAWYLSRKGFDVTVIDRQPGCGMETSKANAGQISYGYSAPWAAPGIPIKATKWLTQKHSPLAISPSMNSEQWLWIAKMLGECTKSRYKCNKSRMLRLANYSKFALAELKAETGIEYEGRQKGLLQIFRSEKQIVAAEKDIAALTDAGTVFSMLSRDECIRQEPALAPVAEKLTGGLYLPDDETGDCHLFTTRLADYCEKLGVRFCFNEEVTDILCRNGKFDSVQTRSSNYKANFCVVAMGSYSRGMVKSLGLELPTYPVKGYSLTVELENPDAAPLSTVMDETNKVALTRFDSRLRVAGTAELSGYDLSLKERRRETISRVIRDLFPDAGNVKNAEFWCGLRPMTPDGTAIIGLTPVPGLFMNTGHGTLGWTMACGSGKLLADLVSGKKPEIESSDLSLSRYTTSSE